MKKHSGGSRHRSSASYRKRKPTEAAFPSRRSDGPGSPVDAERTAQQVRLGIDALQRGAWQDALEYLRRVVNSQPDHALAHNCLGILHRSTGRLDESAEAHNNLGIVYELKGANELALASYRAALHCKPHFAAAHNNLGNVLTKQGQHQEAVEHFDAALNQDPQFVAALNNRGLVLRELQREYEAEVSFRKAIRLQPTFAEAYLNLGNVLREKKSPEAAIECFRLARQHKPGLVAAAAGHGNALIDLGRPQEACVLLEEATRSAPESADIWFALGMARRQTGQHRAAADSYRQAVVCRPDFAEAHNNLANALASDGDLSGAIDVLQRAIEIVPDYLPALNNLGNLYRLQDRLDEAANCYREVLTRREPKPLDSLRLTTLCPTVFDNEEAMREYAEGALEQWTRLRGSYRYRTLSDLLAVANEPPYNLQFFSNDIRPWKEAYANIFEYGGPQWDLRTAGSPYRLGCVVTAQHEIAFLRLIWDALRRLDPQEFQLTIICMPRAAEKFRQQIPEPHVQILALPESPEAILKTLADAAFDLLYYFEICTDALNYFLPFFRLAPVQCTSWGIQVTSGIGSVDYYLSNEFVEPPGAQEHYSEDLVLAKTLLAYQTPVRAPVPARPRESFGFSGAQTIYLCAQHLGKLHPDFDPLLGEILRGDPHGLVVVTKDRHGYGAQRLRSRLRRTIPDVADRVVFLARQSLPDYVSLVAAADVLLDPIHFSGVNTTYDALALDQPIVSWPSSFHRGRYTYGCYRKMQVLDCVADSAEAYVRIATSLGKDRELRQETRQKIRAAKNCLFQDARSIAEHTRIFRDLIERVRRQ